MAVLEQAPAAAPLVAHPLAQLAVKTQHIEKTRAALESAQNTHRSLDVLEALVELDQEAAQTALDTPITNSPGNSSMAQRYGHHLERESSIIAATRWLTRDARLQAAVPAPLLRAIENAARPALRYRCAACSFEARQHFWQCPGCQAWDSYPARRVEEL
jgi:lipopolysaccharide biosynthesis regulator YciM